MHIITRNLDNDTTLTWEASPGAQYEIVWRELSAPSWQFSVAADKFAAAGEAGNSSVTLPISKDNVIFGVRSVDAHGHRSQAVVPLPQR